MDKYVITIARQYGSGGRTIGEMLAKQLNIPYYDKELIKKASDLSGINEGLFAESDEKIRNSLLGKVAKKTYDGTLIAPGENDFLSSANLFSYQAEIIKQLAEAESCVIIGRCADFVLKDFDNVLSVFIHAPEDFCIEQAMLKHSMPLKELDKFILKTDKQRADYYKLHTGLEWTDARNYDLCLNSGKLGFQRCVDEIISYMKIRFE